jgi:hypothetical protein
MLNFYYFYPAKVPTTAHLLAGHDSWNKDNHPDKVEGIKENVKKGTAGKNETTLRLEGGLHHQMPKGVIWRQRHEQHSAASRSTKTMVNISIHALSPIHDFYARVRSVCIELKSTSNEMHTFRLSRADIVKTIRMDGRVSACVLSHYLITYRYDSVQLDLPHFFSFYLPLVTIHYFLDSDSCK